MAVVNTTLLWVHPLNAVLFIGGSFFGWLVLLLVSRGLAPEEATRTLLVGRVGPGLRQVERRDAPPPPRGHGRLQRLLVPPVQRPAA